MTAASPNSDLAARVDRLSRARTLFGWPVRLLDDLAALAERAEDGGLDIDQWRQDAGALLSDAPPAPGEEELRPVRREALLRWLGTADEPGHESRMLRLHTRLGAFTPPPSDEQLWEELERLTGEMRAGDADLREARWRRIDRIRRWLTRNWTQADQLSGLPWPELGRFRWVDVEKVGLVPASLALARARARAAVAARPKDDVVRVRARLLGGDDASALGASMAELDAYTTTGLAQLVLAQRGARSRSRRELVAAFEELWQSPAMDALLLEHTGAGWPARYARPRRPRR